MDHLTLVLLGLLVPQRMRHQFSDAPTRPNHSRPASRTHDPRRTRAPSTSRAVRTLVGCVAVGLNLAACQGVGDARATATFRDCVERHGVVAESVEVTLRGGAIDSISLQVLREGDLLYEPTVRLACIEEVESQ